MAKYSAYLVVCFSLLACTAQISVPASWTITGNLIATSGPCQALKLSATNAGYVPSGAETKVALSVTGNAAVFASLADCVTNHPATAITVFPGQSSATFYFKDYSNETFAIQASGASAPISIQTTRQIFSSGSGFGAGFAQFMVAPPDGTSDMLISGNFSTYNGTTVGNLIRVRRDGSLDPIFTANSGTALDGEARTILPMTDGSNRFYVVGAFTHYNGVPAGGIARFFGNGKPDATFNASGIGFTGVGDVQYVIDAGDGTGDIVVVGFYGGYNGNSSAGITRMHADGSLDAAFHSGTGLNSWNPTVIAAPGEPGKIYVGVGGSNTYNGTPFSTHIVKLNRDGTLDSTFAPGAGFDGAILSLAAANDGTTDIYAGGFFSNYNNQLVGSAARFRKDGSLSPLFNSVTGAGGSILALFTSLNAASPGTLYIGNISTFDGIVVGNFARSLANGTLDSSFNNTPGFNAAVYALTEAVDGSGDVWVGGPFTTFDGTTTNGLVRLTRDGQLP